MGRSLVGVGRCVSMEREFSGRGLERRVCPTFE